MKCNIIKLAHERLSNSLFRSVNINSNFSLKTNFIVQVTIFWLLFTIGEQCYKCLGLVLVVNRNLLLISRFLRRRVVLESILKR